MEKFHAIGRRKTSVARVYLTSGNGNIVVNKKDYKKYFPTNVLQYILTQAQGLAGVDNQFDVDVNVYGGGVKGQAEAIRLGISRALCNINPEHRIALKPAGLMTRDPRMVERKKFGRRKARRRFQFSKR
jgi:small subunit ribosomal protein S9